MDLPAIDQHNVLRCHIFHPAVDKKARGAFKSCIDLQFRMPMAFDNLASRPGVLDDEARDSSVYLHFFKMPWSGMGISSFLCLLIIPESVE